MRGQQDRRAASTNARGPTRGAYVGAGALGGTGGAGGSGGAGGASEAGEAGGECGSGATSAGRGGRGGRGGARGGAGGRGGQEVYVDAIFVARRGRAGLCRGALAPLCGSPGRRGRARAARRSGDDGAGQECDRRALPLPINPKSLAPSAARPPVRLAKDGTAGDGKQPGKPDRRGSQEKGAAVTCEGWVWALHNCRLQKRFPGLLAPLPLPPLSSLLQLHGGPSAAIERSFARLHLLQVQDGSLRGERPVHRRPRRPRAPAHPGVPCPPAPPRARVAGRIPRDRPPPAGARAELTAPPSPPRAVPHQVRRRRQRAPRTAPGTRRRPIPRRARRFHPTAGPAALRRRTPSRRQVVKLLSRRTDSFRALCKAMHEAGLDPMGWPSARPPPAATRVGCLSWTATPLVNGGARAGAPAAGG